MKYILSIALAFITAASFGQYISPRQVLGLSDSLAKKQRDLGWFDVTAFGAVPNDNNDDRNAIQAAINAAAAKGTGTVFFPLGTYILAGALVTSVNGTNPNCQLYIPLTQAGTSMARIRLLGESPPQWSSEVIVGQGRNTKGVILKSTITGTGTAPAVFGTPWYSWQYGPFNFTFVDVENIVVRVKTKNGSTEVAPSMSGFRFGRIGGCTWKNVKVEPESVAVDLVSPQGTGTIGFEFPYLNNKGVAYAENIFAEGMEKGATISEHANINDYIGAACYIGLETSFGSHLSTIGHMKVEGNVFNIRLNGDLPLVIKGYDTEHYYGPEWYSFQKDIAWVSGSWPTTIIQSKITKSGGGPDPFKVDAGAVYTVMAGDGQTAFSAYLLSSSMSQPDATGPQFAAAYLTNVENAGGVLTQRAKDSIMSFGEKIEAYGLRAKLHGLFFFAGLNNESQGIDFFYRYSGGPAAGTPTAQGMQLNGSQHYPTVFYPRFAGQSYNLGITQKIANATVTGFAASGAYNNGSGGQNPMEGISLNYNGTNTGFVAGTDLASVIIPNPSDFSKIMTVVRRAANDLEAYIDKASVGTNSTTVSSTLTDRPLYVGARNANGTAEARLTGTVQIFAIHQGLSSAEVAALHTLLLNVNTGLGR